MAQKRTTLRSRARGQALREAVQDGPVHRYPDVQARSRQRRQAPGQGRGGAAGVQAALRRSDPDHVLTPSCS